MKETTLANYRRDSSGQWVSRSTGAVQSPTGQRYLDKLREEELHLARTSCEMLVDTGSPYGEPQSRAKRCGRDAVCEECEYCDEHCSCEPCEPLILERKLSVDNVTVLFRYPCACGWRGCWYSKLEQASESWRRHRHQQGDRYANRKEE